MQGTVTNITLPSVRPTLDVVRNQFETWRKRRRCRGRIPESLWQAAAGLCREHSIYEVCRTLRLNYHGLKERVVRGKGESPAIDQPHDHGFVRLDFGVPMTASECLVEMEAPNFTMVCVTLLIYQ